MKPIPLNKFLLNQAAFNQHLQTSILNKDMDAINVYIQINCDYELSEKLITLADDLDIDRLRRDLLEQLKETDWEWAK